MRIRAALVTIYAFISILVFLTAYPVAPDIVTSLMVAAALAATGATVAYSVPRYSGIVFFLALMLAVLNIMAASNKPWLSLAMRDVALFTFYAALVLVALAAAVSIRRYLGVVALATGLLASAALVAPYGHLAALSLLALYATLSGSITRTLMALVYEETMRSTLVFYSLITGKPRCFDSFADLARLLKPVKPLVDALLAPTGAGTPAILAQLYTILEYNVATLLASAAILSAISYVTRFIRGRITRWVPEAAAVTKHTIIYAGIAAPLAFFATLNASIAASIVVGCRFNAPLTPTIAMGVATSILALLVQILVLISSLRSLREEKAALKESIQSILEEESRIREKLEGSLISPLLYERIASDVKKLAEDLYSRIESADLLSLPSMERLLAELEARHTEAQRKLVELLAEVVDTARRVCASISNWAASNNLPEGECEKIERMETADPHMAILSADRALRHLIDYLHLLVDEVADILEEAGLDAREAEEIHEMLDKFRVEKPSDIEELRDRVIERLSRLIGMARARGE